MTRPLEIQVIGLCQSLVQTRSYSGEEKTVGEKLKTFFLKNGYDEVHIDQFGNVIGHIKGNAPGKKILFDGHMDTVPVVNEEKWTHGPFSGELTEGKIYGRGTSDMKGALAAMACAAAQFARDTKKQFAGDIYVAGVVHEECFEGVAARAISAYVKPDVVIIGEASNLNLKIGQRGRGEVVLETFGVPAHSANPEKGVNAVYAMTWLIQAIRQLVPPTHPVLGKGILELTDIKSSPYPGASVVPEYCKATYDRRLLVDETRESVLAPLEEALKQVEKAHPEVKAKVSFARGEETCYTGNKIEGERFFPGWLFEQERPEIQAVKAALEQGGFAPQITQYNFCTNGSHYAGEAGILTMGLGPSDERLAHTIDEYIEVEQLTKVTDCYILALKGLLSPASAE